MQDYQIQNITKSRLFNMWEYGIAEFGTSLLHWWEIFDLRRLAVFSNPYNCKVSRKENDAWRQSKKVTLWIFRSTSQRLTRKRYICLTHQYLKQPQHKIGLHNGAASTRSGEVADRFRITYWWGRLFHSLRVLLDHELLISLSLARLLRLGLRETDC
jgi:hypothetical protein